MSRSNNFLKVLIISLFLFLFVVNLAITLDKAFADVSGECCIYCTCVSVCCDEPCSVDDGVLTCPSGKQYVCA